MARTISWIVVIVGLVAGTAAQGRDINLARYQNATKTRPIYEKMMAAKAAFAAKMVVVDGRMLNHLPYPKDVEADIPKLDPIEEARSTQPCDLATPAGAALRQLLDAANADPKSHSDGYFLRAFSCFRSIDDQVRVFCKPLRTGTCTDPAERAKTSAPWGYSEHATGFTLDFAVRDAAGHAPPDCKDVDVCFGTKAGSDWLQQNAGRFGFEMSFPKDNCQGVSFEPWHWRWVGTADDRSDNAARARAVFARARRDFPAIPAVPGIPAPAGGAASNHCPRSPAAAH